MPYKVKNYRYDSDTCVKEIIQRIMPTASSVLQVSEYSEVYEYRDISIIKRSICTSNCAFIDTTKVIAQRTSKPKCLSSDTSHKCNIQARKLLADIQSSQSIDTRISMRSIYQMFIKNQRERNYGVCDEIINMVDVEHTDLEILVSLLMASNTIKNKLHSRVRLYSEVFEKAKLLYSIEEAEQILCNLI